MRRQKTIADREVNGERLRIVAQSRTYMGNPNGFNVVVNGKEFYVRCLSIDEAMDKALARFLGTGRSSTVKKQQIKVGQEYLCEIGRNDVKVVAVSVPAMGSITLKTVATHKTVKIADPARLKPVPGGTAATRDEGAHVAAPAAETPTTTKVGRGRHTRQQGAPQAQGTKKPKKTGLLDAAILVMREAGQPMNTQEMVEAVQAKRLWSSDGKTPAATLYSSILREIQKKGEDARFTKTERGKFSLKS